MEIIISVIYLAVAALFIVSMWKINVKCGEPGWACLVPIYNAVILLRMAKRELFPSILLLFVPIVNIYITFVIWKSIAEKLRKQPSGDFAVGILLLPVVFIPVLAFSNQVDK